MSTYERPSLFDEMIRASKAAGHLWYLRPTPDGRHIASVSPSSAREQPRELIVLGHMIVWEHSTSEGVWSYRASRAEAEWRADLDIDFERGAPCMKAYPHPIKTRGTFTAKRRVTLEYSAIVAMFGEIAA